MKGSTSVFEFPGRLRGGLAGTSRSHSTDGATAASLDRPLSNYISAILCLYIGIVEKNMETTIIQKGNI